GGDDRRGRHHCCRHQVAHAVRAFRWDGTSLRRCQLSCVIARLDRATQYASVSPGLLGRPLSRAMTRLFDSIRTKHALAAALRPHHTLVAGLYLSDALEVELLYAFALIGLGRIDVALGIDRDAVHAEELAGLAAAAAERGQFGQSVAL